MSKLQSFGHWNLVRPLGEGAFGEVYHFKNGITGQEIATKRLKANLKLKQDEIEILHIRWEKEYVWMKTLTTKYIVGAINIKDSDFLDYLMKQNPYRHTPVIIMEYCNSGDLREHLNKPENLNGLKEHEVRDVLTTLRFAIEYLHNECNIEHRDIKPENIVIHYDGKQRFYKLTDFGYARDIPDSTIQQSVVGTRHYVAPEVVDPGCYTNTVDYWSIGVLAFEIICGTRPFIPHQPFINILTNIKAKPRKCIAIKQVIDDPITNRFSFEDKIFPEHHSSPIFTENMEKWLRLALDNDYKNRGIENNELKFYHNLDVILNTKIFTVFSLKSYEIYFYNIEKFNNIEEFFKKISQDTQIALNKIFLILPPGHPKGILSNIKLPIDFYVPQWMDISNMENPPVMLYVSDTEQCDFNVKVNNINVSNTIKKCIQQDPTNCKNIYDNIWLLEQFEKHVHYILSKEQYNLECYCKGLSQYVINVEDEVFRYENQIDNVFENTMRLSGRIQQFEATVKEFIKNKTEEVSNLWLEKALYFSNKSKQLTDDIIEKVKKRFKSVHRHCKTMATNDINICNTLVTDDIYKLNDFRLFLSQKHYPEERMAKCQHTFDNFFDIFQKKIINNISLKEIRENIHKQFKIYLMIRKLIEDYKKYIDETLKKLQNETEILMQSTLPMFSNDPALSIKMQSLSIDGNDNNHAASLSNILMNGHTSMCNGDAVFDRQTAEVLMESNKLLSLIHSTMDVDEDCAMGEELPTTINNI